MDAPYSSLALLQQMTVASLSRPETSDDDKSPTIQIIVSFQKDATSFRSEFGLRSVMILTRLGSRDLALRNPYVDGAVLLLFGLKVNCI